MKFKLFSRTVKGSESLLQEDFQIGDYFINFRWIEVTENAVVHVCYGLQIEKF